MASQPAQDRVIELENYIVVCSEANSLGKGGFGEVWKGRHRTDPNVEVAVKILNEKKCEKKYLDRENNFGRKIAEFPHSNVVRCIGTETVGNCTYFMFELCEKNLNELFKDARQKIPFQTCVRYMRDMASGVAYLHALKICHRDLKPQNVLVKDDCLKIGDLGLARDFPEGSSTPAFATPNTGTSGWLAPEIQSEYEEKVDVFSLALIFFAMLTHKLGESLKPHRENGVYLADWMRVLASQNIQVTVPPLCVQTEGEPWMAEVLALIRKMLCFKPKDRININNVCTRINEIILGKLSGAGEKRAAEGAAAATPHKKQKPGTVTIRDLKEGGNYKNGVLKVKILFHTYNSSRVRNIHINVGDETSVEPNGCLFLKAFADKAEQLKKKIENDGARFLEIKGQLAVKAERPQGIQFNPDGLLELTDQMSFQSFQNDIGVECPEPPIRTLSNLPAPSSRIKLEKVLVVEERSRPSGDGEPIVDLRLYDGSEERCTKLEVRGAVEGSLSCIRVREAWVHWSENRKSLRCKAESIAPIEDDPELQQKWDEADILPTQSFSIPTAM